LPQFPLRVARHHDRLAIDGLVARRSSQNRVTSAVKSRGPETARIDHDEAVADIVPCGFFVCVGSVINVAPERHAPRMFTMTASP